MPIILPGDCWQVPTVVSRWKSLRIYAVCGSQGSTDPGARYTAGISLTGQTLLPRKVLLARLCWEVQNSFVCGTFHVEHKFSLCV